MRTAGFGSLISQSIDQTKNILFRPFSLKKWLLILWIAFLAGAGGGNQMNWRSPGNIPDKAEQETQEALPAAEDAAPSQVSEPASQTVEPPIGTLEEQLRKIPRATLVAVGLFSAALLLILIITFMWLHSRFRFVWINSLAHNITAVREPFGRFKIPGQSLFKVNLLLTGISFGVLLIFAMGTFIFLNAQGMFEQGKSWNIDAVFAVIGIPFLVLMVLLIPAAILGWVIQDICVPLMYLESVPLTAVWKKSWKIFRENLWDFIKFALINIGVTIVRMIIQMVVVLVAVLGIGLISLILFGLLYLTFSALLKMQSVFVLLSLILGIPFAIASILAFMLVNLPFTVFASLLPLYFLSSLGPESKVLEVKS